VDKGQRFAIAANFMNGSALLLLSWGCFRAKALHFDVLSYSAFKMQELSRLFFAFIGWRLVSVLDMFWVHTLFTTCESLCSFLNSSLDENLQLRLRYSYDRFRCSGRLLGIISHYVTRARRRAEFGLITKSQNISMQAGLGADRKTVNPQG